MLGLWIYGWISKTSLLSRLSLLTVDTDQVFWIISFWIMTWVEYYTSPWVKFPSFSGAGLLLWYLFIVISLLNGLIFFLKKKKSTTNPVDYRVLFRLHFCRSSFSNSLPPDIGSKGRERTWDLWFSASGIWPAISLQNAWFSQALVSLIRGTRPLKKKQYTNSQLGKWIIQVVIYILFWQMDPSFSKEFYMNVPQKCIDFSGAHWLHAVTYPVDSMYA